MTHENTSKTQGGQKNEGPISVDEILEKARNRSPFQDWGDDGFLDALRAQVEAFNREADPAPFARSSFKRNAIFTIVRRMALVDWWTRHPEILEQPVNQPIFVTGMPRCGTTFLHRLISQDPNNRPLLFWEQQTPVPPPEPETYETDQRIGWAEKSLNNLFQAAPAMQTIHPMTATGPEECNGLFELAFSNMASVGLHHMPSFLEWMLTCDMAGAYRFYKKVLQLLNWKIGGVRWCLKCPSHLNFLDTLLTVFPDAAVIWNHRHPRENLASASSLVHLYRKMTTGREPEAIGLEVASGLKKAVDRAMETRKTAPPQHFFDVSYPRLVKDPMGLVHDIYQHYGFQWTGAFEEAMAAWIKDNKKDKHGVHRYALEDFGLTEAWIQKQFAPYLDAYGELL